jgi:glycosyltransferase involved in cell wall biosynthesis
MKVGFLENKLTLRGTTVGIYDYADYNETILGNSSVIITRPYEHVAKISPGDMNNSLAYDKFERRFPVYYYKDPIGIVQIVKENGIDVLFIEKGGDPFDNLVFDPVSCCKSIIHCVFCTRYPHGTLFTTTSEFINKNKGTNVPVLPYVIKVHPTHEHLRGRLNIPSDATVFGFYGGYESFDIDYVRQAVIDVATAFKNIYFVFMNIKEFGPKLDNVIFLPGSYEYEDKRKFINTCDAMIYGRKDGETFGLAVGEFTICNKLVIGRKTGAGNELEYLKENMILHDNYGELVEILTNWEKYTKDVVPNQYHKFTPEYVMGIFKQMLEAIK